MTAQRDPTTSAASPLLEAILNLARFHREHEKFYASSPRELAVRLQRHARTLLALADDWQAAAMSSLVARLLQRAADILDRVDFAPAALRADLAAHRTSVGRLYSAAELISRAADLSSDSAGLVHDNERRWRTFRGRVGRVVGHQEGTTP